MFIPKRCPKCRDIAGWQKIYDPMLTNSFEKFIIFMKGYSTRNYVYRCEKCGFEAEYDDHAETIDRRWR